MQLLVASAIALLAGAVPAQLVHKSFVGGQPGERMGHSVGYIATLTSSLNTQRILLGEPWFDAGAGGVLVDAGKVSYYHGSALNGAPLATKLGDAAGDLFGWAVAGVGDVNGDGHSDYAISAPFADVTPGGNEGRVRVYLGLNSALQWTLDGTQSGAQFGYALGGAGDVNGDGRADIAVGEPFFNGGAGRVLIYSGMTGLLLGARMGNAGSHLGWSVAGVGDVNADGRSDVAAGAPDDATAGAAAGRVVVISFNGTVLQDHPGTAGAQFGWSVNGGMDANNDGKLDLVIGAPGTAGDSGAAQIRTGPALTAIWQQFSGAPGDRLGAAVDFAGDPDKDSFDDVIVGAPQVAGGPGQTGRVTVYSGQTGAQMYSVVTGAVDGDEQGFAVCGAGDANLDGWDDIVVGAPLADGGGNESGGAQLIGWQYVQPDVGGGGVGDGKLVVYGQPLATGWSALLSLSGAAPSAPAYLLASIAAQPLPFKGGVLVPNVSFSAIFLFTTNAQGTVPALPVPGGGGAFSVWVQFVVKDLTEAGGWELTHCTRMDFLL